MLRARTIGRIAGLLAFAFALGAAQHAFAGGNVQGTWCPTNGVSAGIGTGAGTDGNNLVCVSNVWQYPVYVMQSAAASAQSSCSSYPSGAERWNTTLSNLEVCDGTTWQLVGVGTSTCGSVSGLSFTNVSSASLNTSYTTTPAATITFSGCSGALSVSVTGVATAQISVNGGAWSTSGAIQSGQTLQVRLTSSGSVSTGLTATVTVGSSSTNWTVTTRSGSLRVFQTSASEIYIAGNLGGLSGADAYCQSDANAAGYSGTWMAILSSDTVSAASRLTLSYPIVNAYDGTTVAATNLWSGSITTCIKSPTGACTAFVMSGTTAAGGIETGYTCASWTSTSGNFERGDGQGQLTSDWITHSTLGSCGSSATDGLYCIQQ